MDYLFKQCLHQFAAGSRTGQQFSDGNQKKQAAERQILFAVTVGEIAKVADALKTGRQRVQQKPADELVGGNGHDL